MSIIFPEQIGKRPVDKSFRAQIEHGNFGLSKNGKRKDEKLFLDGGKTERILLENRSEICLSTKKKDGKTSRARILSTGFRRRNVAFTKAAQNFFAAGKVRKE